jgi:tRNA pseudouridine32 synthase/23S rRNA pseudouridine746 synthase
MDWIVARHSEFWLANKPAGTDFHDSNGNTGFFNQVRSQAQRDLYPVHRLDKVTSGLLLVATSQEACAELTALFAQQQVTKHYLAIASSKPRKKQGTIAGDMLRSRRGTWRLARTNNNPAVTQFTSSSIEPGLRLYKLAPKTGKTHQLRVAMKSLGAPILGDTAYGGVSADRVYLHAFALEFNFQGQHYRFWQPPQTGAKFLDLDLERHLNPSPGHDADLSTAQTLQPQNPTHLE